jgi:hypothetical protein
VLPVTPEALARRAELFASTLLAVFDPAELRAAGYSDEQIRAIAAGYYVK